MNLSPDDAMELAELLQFLGGWLRSDRGNLAASLTRFVGSPAYGPDALRDDFARFRFLLGTPTARASSPPTSREPPSRETSPGASGFRMFRRAGRGRWRGLRWR